MTPSHPARPIALAIAAAIVAVALRAGGRAPAGGALAQGYSVPRPGVGDHWPEVAVTGVVLGAPGGTPGPVADARVIVHTLAGKCEASTRSNGSGGFGRRCRDVSKAAVFELHALAPGHAVRVVRQSPHSHVGGDPNAGPGELNVVIELTPETPAPEPTPEDGLTYVTLMGAVVDGGRADEPPVAGARVVAAYDDEEFAYACLSPVVTDAFGRFEIVCPYAHYFVPIRLSVVADGFAVGGDTWHMGVGGLGGPERIVLQPAPTAPPTATSPPPGTPTATPTAIDRADRLPAVDITGVVVDIGDPDLPPKAGVRVVTFARPGWCGPSVVTGADGAFTLRCVDLSWRGEVEVHAFDADGGRTDVWAQRFELGRAGAWGNAIRVHVPFPIRPGARPTGILEHAYYERVHGRITGGGSPGAPPVRSAVVTIEGAQGRFLAPVRTDDDGVYEIVSPWRWFFNRSHTLVVTAPGRAPHREKRMWDRQMPGGLRWDVVLPGDGTGTPGNGTPSPTTTPIHTPAATQPSTPTATPPMPPVILPWAGRPS